MPEHYGWHWGLPADFTRLHDLAQNWNVGGAEKLSQLKSQPLTTSTTYISTSRATDSRVLRRADLSRLGDLQPKPQVQRYEREAPGELLHIDIKRLDRWITVRQSSPQQV